MTVHAQLSIITLYANGLDSLIQREREENNTEWMNR